MKTGFLLLFFCWSLIARSQNLVPNPSFEINIGCPDQINQVDKADGWSTWGGTPDYYHSCANVITPAFGTPANNRGYQMPHSGDAYIALFTFSDLAANTREFVGRELQQPLVPGQQYFISFWICSVEQLLATHASDRIGVRFTTAPHTMFDPDTALNNGHVFSSVVVADSVNWTLVSGMFLADSAYTHMGIGNYFDDTSTTLITGHPTSNYAYYLIDDICVSPDPQFCAFETGIITPSPPVALSLLPNPASNRIRITILPAGGAHPVRIYDVSGRRLISAILEGPEQELDIEGLPPGMYVVSVEANGSSTQAKFVKLPD